MDYIAIDTSEYLEHHGILGQKWGVRRTASQLGHATASRIQILNRRIDQAKEQHTSNVNARNLRKASRDRAKVAKIQSKNDILRKKAEQEELKTRIKQTKDARKPNKGGDGNNSRGLVASAWTGVKGGVSGGISRGTSDLISKAIGAAVNKHYSDILSDPNTSNGKKLFATYMGGKTEASARNEWDLERAVSKGKHYNTSVEDLQMAYERSNNNGKKKKEE